MTDFTVKNKDGTVDKKETARLKYNAARLKDMVAKKTDMFGKVRAPRLIDIPKEAILAGARQLLAGAGAKQSQTELQLKRIAKQIQKKYLGKFPPVDTTSAPKKKASGGKVKKTYAMGGGIRKANYK